VKSLVKSVMLFDSSTRKTKTG